MAVTAFWFLKAQEGQYGTTAARRVDWASDTIKVALASSSYTPNQDTHDFFDDVTNEVTGTNWAAGGVSLSNKTVTIDAATNETRLDADDVSVANVTVSGARYAIIYKSTGSAATSPLLGWVDFGGDQSVSGATFAITWASSGVLKTTTAT